MLTNTALATPSERGSAHGNCGGVRHSTRSWGNHSLAMPRWRSTKCSAVGKSSASNVASSIAVPPPLVETVCLIVERFTTGANYLDEAETGWTELHFRGPARPGQTNFITLPR